MLPVTADVGTVETPVMARIAYPPAEPRLTAAKDAVLAPSCASPASRAASPPLATPPPLCATPPSATSFGSSPPPSPREAGPSEELEQPPSHTPKQASAAFEV